jgi:chemotaxis protein MotA
MCVLFGLAVVTVSVLAGFVLAGGPLLLLLQPVEDLIIEGAAAGSLLIGTSPAILRQLIRQIKSVVRARSLWRSTSTSSSCSASSSSRRSRTV